MLIRQRALTGAYFLNNGEFNPSVDAGLVSRCKLTLGVEVGPCRVEADTLLRTVTANINWTDAVYTYDFLFGEDTILLSYLGRTDTIIVNSLMGDTSITFKVNQAAPITVIAGFTLDTLCRDTVITESFIPCIYDLAFTKTVDTSGTSFPLIDDDTVKFRFTVYNQGTIDAENIVIKDHIPCGFTIIPNVGNLIAADSTVFIPGPVAPGSFATASVYLRLQQPLDLPVTCRGNTIYDNYAEIISAQDPFGDQPKDVDSNPNSNSPEEQAVLPNGPGDNDTLSMGINDLGSEDDHDPANVQIFDLALRKNFDGANPGPYFAVGDTVKYVITIFNQGNVIADSLVIVDTIFAGLEFINTSLNAGWVDIGSSQVQFDTSFSQAMAMGIDTFVLGDSINICLYLRVLTSSDPNAYLNMAQISAARDTLGTTLFGDNDSPYDMGFLDNPGGAPDSPTDDYIGGIGTGVPGGTDPKGDDDSHDPALFLVPVSVGDTTFIDANRNGMQDPMDAPLPGVTVTLFQIDPITGMGIPVTTSAFGLPYNNVVITDENGAYLFDSLPHGQYYVVFDVTTVALGEMYIQTTENANGSSLDPNDSDANSHGQQRHYVVIDQ